ncbi:hypothetical protein [Ralstonia wenshanensis]|uniref:hypothetical protein n=1 Tax=Ralstonia wenshanensis TaxID=2842456 RepID=UPI003D978317
MGTILPFERYRARKELQRYAPRPANDLPLEATYRRDLDIATDLLVQHVESGLYDGIALALRPISPEQELVSVVAGAFRHRLHEASDAALQLHADIQLRASEQSTCASSEAVPSRFKDLRTSTFPSARNMQTASLYTKWNEATALYQRCEQMVRLAFCAQLRATPETTAILLTITQLHIETVANCLWELARQPGRISSQTKLDVLNAIQHFRTARLHVSAWMPPTGQEDAYFASNAEVLTDEMIDEGVAFLANAQNALEKVAGDLLVRSVGT